MIRFSVETYDDVIDEIKPLLDWHWEEVAIYKDKIKFKADYSKYEDMQDSGHLHIVTVRDEDMLVGYFISFLMDHPHYSDHKYALNDILYLHPDYRHADVACGMFEYAEKDLKSKGVSVMVVHMKTQFPFKTLCEVQGFEMAEYNYSKYIGD